MRNDRRGKAEGRREGGERTEERGEYTEMNTSKVKRRKAITYMLRGSHSSIAVFEKQIMKKKIKKK